MIGVVNKSVVARAIVFLLINLSEVMLMKMNPVRYSSAVGEVWVMVTFKVKYCHAIFDFAEVRASCDELLHEAYRKYGIRCEKVGFDANHVHQLIDLGLLSKPEMAKKLKGYVGRKLLQRFPWVKKAYFWGSGLWNPAYDIRSVHDMAFYRRYLDKQKYSTSTQSTLSSFAA